MKPTLVTPPPQRRDRIDDQLRNVEVGEDPAERRRRADAEERDAGEARGVVQRDAQLPATPSVR